MGVAYYPMWPTSTKKRLSPDTDATRAFTSPGSQRQSKRARMEGFRVLGHGKEHLTGHEPLRNPDANVLAQSDDYDNPPSAQSSQSKLAPPGFAPRSQSVPLGGGREVRAMDLTSISPSPRHSPNKCAVEITRAPSVPLPDRDRMDVDPGDTSVLLHFTNPTQPCTPRANPVFHYTVNFATPCGSARPARSTFSSGSPLSPLTPLPLSPFTERSPQMQGLLAKANTKLLALCNKMDVDTKTPTGSMITPSGVDMTVQRSPRRVTRSVSTKEQRVKVERAEIEDVALRNCTAKVPVSSTSTAGGPSSELEAMAPPPTTLTSKPRLPKSTGATTSKSRASSTTHTSASASKILPDTSKLKQTSLNIFIKGKPSAVPLTAEGRATTSTSTSIGSLSRFGLSSSPSKIPLVVSPLKRTSTSKSRNTFQFPPGRSGTDVGASTSHETPGRSLTTLSHALDKLVVPPPSRPNTSMGFVSSAGASEEQSTLEKRKGKWKAKDDTSLSLASTTQGLGTTFARPTASSLKRAATVTGFGSTGTTRMRGQYQAVAGRVGRGRAALGIFGKAGDRASKKTNLPVVAGSPIKGSGGTGDSDWDMGTSEHKSSLEWSRAKDAGRVTGKEGVLVSQDALRQEVSTEPLIDGGGNVTSPKLSSLAATNASNGTEADLTTSPASADKGKQRPMPPSTLNPASSALHALSESLSSLPQTPPLKARAVGIRTGLRSSSAAAGKESPSLDGSGSTGLGGNSEVHGSGGAGPSIRTMGGSSGAKKSSLKVLKRCAIFVDVRTEQGDDAGSLFVDMLKGLGAKIMGRLGQTCTHIVYKNGLPNTLARYRMLNDPKPVVVGIAWVVECAEKRARVDEEKFKIDVDMINVAGSNNKRRRSTFSKHLIPVSPGPSYNMPMHLSSEADDEDEGTGGIEASPSQDPDISIRSREDDLPPLERARRRRSILPGGQTRLVP